MRKLLFALLLLPYGLSAQDFPRDPQGNVFFENVVQAPALTKKEIFTRLMVWAGSRFTPLNEVLEYSDKEEGVILLKSSLPVNIITYDGSSGNKQEGDGGSFAYTLTFFIKDGKFKYRYTDFVHFAREDNVLKLRNCGSIENEDCGKGAFAFPNKRQWADLKKQIPDKVGLQTESILDTMESTVMNF